ncbi:MAG: allantoinase AllB [Tissierellia bacterium]|nr:allantoinase AllB [Tissierellia bacterium]
MYDLLIKNGLVVTHMGEKKADILVKDGKIAAIGSKLDVEANEVIDATDLIVTPGMIDSHTHITEPGGGYRDNWEGYLTGTKAAAKGGVTSFVEMPLNQVPCTQNKEALEIKVNAGKDKLTVDVFSLAALTPSSLDDIKEMAEEGVLGFKAFMASCGDRSIDGDMENVDDYSLWEGMRRIKDTSLSLHLHCENPSITDKLGKLYAKERENTLENYVDSRPVFTEVEAVRRAIFFAKETGCKLTICHCSCPEVVDEIKKARAEGVDIVAESCTHYFYFTTDELDSIGNSAKCSPPLRDKNNLEEMWKRLFAGDILYIGSDHSPCTPDLKEGKAFSAWGGISSLQNSYDILFDEAVNKRNMSLSQFVDITATNVARYLGLKNKGAIEVGFDADFALIDKNKSYTITEDGLEYKNKFSAFVGREVGCKIVRTIVRGETVYSEENGVTDKKIGKFLFKK